MMKKRTASLSTRLVVIFCLILIASNFLVGTIGYFLNRNDAIRLNSDRAVSIAQTVASGIDTAAFERTVQSGVAGAYWYEVEAMLDAVITDNHLAYLYVLYGYDDENVYYFAEGMSPDSTDEEIVFQEAESLEYHDENLMDAFGGAATVSEEIYSAEEWGYLVTGLSPITAPDGRVVGVVGADVPVNEVLASANQFGLLILVLVVGISAVMGITIALYLRRVIGKPIRELIGVSSKIARGETDIEIATRSDNEIGELADSFREMVLTIRQQAQTLQAIAGGDLSIVVTPRSGSDTMGLAFIDMIDKLNGMMTQINDLTARVADESGRIAQSARSLAKGASSQAAAVEQLSSSVTEISAQTRQNAELADASARLANTVREEATSSFSQMEQLITAVKEISEAAGAIRYVMKVIDDIAFQTNILSLNASVEAARVGEQGSGFAVVSREVQTLSRQTSESAKETASLINDTMVKTKLGVELAEAAYEAMRKVVESIRESDRIANEIAMSSREQMTAIKQVNDGINQVATVVHQNSTVAEGSAEVSQEMNKQANALSGLISRFKTRR